jgi:hypothetical protein
MNVFKMICQINPPCEHLITDLAFELPSVDIVMIVKQLR